MKVTKFEHFLPNLRIYRTDRPCWTRWIQKCSGAESDVIFIGASVPLISAKTAINLTSLVNI